MVNKNKKTILKTITLLVTLTILIIGAFFIVRNVKKSFTVDEKDSPTLENSIVTTKSSEVIDTHLLDEEAPESSEVIVQGRFNGVEQNIKGKALFLESNGNKFLRLEEFESINGQDLHVYLSPILNLDKNDAIDLGLLKAVSGNFNYPLEKNLDLKKYSNVIIWSNPFNAFFGYASLLTKELKPEPANTKNEITKKEETQPETQQKELETEEDDVN